MENNTGKRIFDMEATEKEFSLNELAQFVCGTSFDQAPTAWQRVIEDMAKRGVKFEVPA